MGGSCTWTERGVTKAAILYMWRCPKDISGTTALPGISQVFLWGAAYRAILLNNPGLYRSHSAYDLRASITKYNADLLLHSKLVAVLILQRMIYFLLESSNAIPHPPNYGTQVVLNSHCSTSHRYIIPKQYEAPFLSYEKNIRQCRSCSPRHIYYIEASNCVRHPPLDYGTQWILKSHCGVHIDLLYKAI